MNRKSKKLFIAIVLTVAVLWGLNFIASKLFMVDVVWLLKVKGSWCGPVNGMLNSSVSCPSGYYCDFSHSIIDGPGRCLKN